MTKDPRLTHAKDQVIENLETLRSSLTQCVDKGMVDLDDASYNQIIELIEDVRILTTWDELEEVIAQAKTLETDVDAWLAIHGQTTISFIWPHIQ